MRRGRMFELLRNSGCGFVTLALRDSVHGLAWQTFKFTCGI